MLSKEDFRELNWSGPTYTTHMQGISFYQLDKHQLLYTDGGYLEIGIPSKISDGILFRGIMKNKEDLKVLMKMLQINDNNNN